jgi:hypothetical protein
MCLQPAVYAGIIAEVLVSPQVAGDGGNRIPPSPPFSLDCRETTLYSSGNCSKMPQFRDSRPETGLEKVLLFSSHEQVSFSCAIPLRRCSPVLGILIPTRNQAHVQQNERWLELCKRAAIESDPKKMLELVTEINDLLDAKDRRRPDVQMRLSTDAG